MLKLKFKLIITEERIDERITERSKSDDENVVEKGCEIMESEYFELYEEWENEDDMETRLGIVWKLMKGEKQFRERHGENLTLCQGCLMPIDIEKVREELLQEGKE